MNNFTAMLRRNPDGNQKIIPAYHFILLCSQHHLFSCHHNVKEKGSDDMKCFCRHPSSSSCSKPPAPFIFVFCIYLLSLLPLLISEKTEGRTPLVVCSLLCLCFLYIKLFHRFSFIETILHIIILSIRS